MGIALKEILGWARSRKFLASLLIGLTLGIGILIGTLISGRVSATRPPFSLGTAPLAKPDPVQLSSAFASIVNKVEPAVVNISTTQVIERGPRARQHGGQGGDQDGDEDQFQDFFNRFFNSPGEADQAERSLGSGVLLDKKGYILTNDHVIEQATKIQVQLNGDQTLYTAKVVGTDEETDLAVIKIDAGKDLPIAQLGNSDGIQVGDWVLAIGSPFGLQATVTAGIISAKDRSNVGARQFQRFIQTDAAINPGNSGGPLVDLAGQVIGINTAIITGSRGYEGVGFALPSNAALTVYNQIVTTGHVTRGSIGVSFSEDQSSNPVLLKELGADYGIVLQSVEPGSPADKAGLQPGDIITSLNGRAVRTGNDLVNPIAESPIGDKLRVTFIRDKKVHETSVTVADRAKIFPEQADNGNNENEGQQSEAAPAEFGLRLEELTPERARRFQYGSQHGVIVTDVEPASFSEDLGFGRGDLIVEINHTAVNSIADYRRLVSALKPGDDVLFKVIRHSGDEQNDRLLTVMLAGQVPAPGQ
ncbi:MAG TPA: Do family serine endopeptidase [Methylomirabilota bacterium]|nr:Do family serine endopeptidase [Methylomirabilota bacterium]